MTKLDESGRARRLVDEQRRTIGDRRGEGERIGAIDGLARSSDRHQRWPAGRGERHQSGLGETARVIAELAGGVASLLREQRDSEGLGAAAKIVEGAIEAELRDPASGVAMDRGRGRRSYERFGVAVDPPRPRGGEIVEEMAKADRAFCRARWRKRSLAPATAPLRRSSRRRDMRERRGRSPPRGSGAASCERPKQTQRPPVARLSPGFDPASQAADPVPGRERDTRRHRP